jgi:hypothetical protein
VNAKIRLVVVASLSVISGVSEVVSACWFEEVVEEEVVVVYDYHWKQPLR